MYYRKNNFQPVVDGELIMRFFKLSPGKKVDEMQAVIKEAIKEGELVNERFPILEFLYHRYRDLLPPPTEITSDMSERKKY